MDEHSGIIRTCKSKENPYTMINKAGLEDARLSFKARGILSYLLSKPDNWQVRTKDLVNNSREGRTSIYSGLKELEEHGYLKRYAVRNEKKRIISWESIVYEEPQEPVSPVAKKKKKQVPRTTKISEKKLETENLKVGFLETGLVEAENRPLINTNVNNKENKQQHTPPKDQINEHKKDVVVSSFSQSNEKKEKITQLMDIGVSKSVAIELTEQRSTSEIELAMGYVNRKKEIDDKPAFVVAALRQEWTLNSVQAKENNTEKEKHQELGERWAGENVFSRLLQQMKGNKKENQAVISKVFL